MNASTHLHRDDFPVTLELLAQVVGPHVGEPPGFEFTETGALVDWDRLAHGGVLSTTERAVVQIARGVATLEHHGAPPSRLCGPVEAAVHAVVGA